MTATATATLTAIPYPRGLISIARGLIDDGLFGIAVVVAHIACEVATERAMTAAFTRRKLSDLKDPVTDLLPSNNLGNERTRRLFTALTRNPVEQQPFWGAFKESATRRNRVIHNALQVTQQEAESSLSVTTALVTFLKQ